ncbi:MAG: type II toxin-antitoxin system HicB family antitoxin [Patescibacteria group bacterium]
MKNTSYTIYIEQDEDGMFIGSIPSVPSCYADGKTQKEMLKNLEQVLKLCLRNSDIKSFAKTKFVGIQNVEIYA